MNRSELPAELEEFVQQELAEGKYRSEAELMADALRFLREHHKTHEGHPENGTSHAPIWEVFHSILKFFSFDRDPLSWQDLAENRC
jgi:hypothetical protein